MRNILFKNKVHRLSRTFIKTMVMSINVALTLTHRTFKNPLPSEFAKSHTKPPALTSRGYVLELIGHCQLALYTFRHDGAQISLDRGVIIALVANHQLASRKEGHTGFMTIAIG